MNRVKMFFALLTEFIAFYVRVARIYFRKTSLKGPFSGASILWGSGLESGIFLILKEQFQNKLGSSLKVLVSIPTYSRSGSGDKSRSESRVTRRGLRSRSQKATTLDKGCWGITGKFIVR